MNILVTKKLTIARLIPVHLFFLLILTLSPVFAAGKLSTSSAHGLSFVLPKGRFGIRTELRTISYDERYDRDGKKIALGHDLDNVNLNSQLFPSIQVFGPTATLGKTQLNSELTGKRFDLTLGYGLTDNLTLGLIIPYGEVDTRVDFNVSGGNIGFNPAFNTNQPITTVNFPFAPAGVSIAPVGTAGVQQILSDPAFGLGYKPIANTHWSGFGDPTLGLLWRFRKTPTSEWIMGTGIRFGITDENDPDNLVDLTIDDGSTDIRTRLEYYRNFSHGFDITVQLEHDFQLEDTFTSRVPQFGQLLASADSKEKLDRNLGDYTELDIGLGKTFGNWRVGAGWHYFDKKSSVYHSRIGSNTDVLEANTDASANQWLASISWSGIDAWKQGNVPIPMLLQVKFQDTYKAKNFPDAGDVYLQLTSFF